MEEGKTANGKTGMSTWGRGKWIAAAAGTVLLGAVGSGVWEVLFAPSMSWVYNASLTAVTLGLDSVRDGIYRDVAKGFREQPSLAMLAFGVGMTTGATVVVLALPFHANKAAQSAMTLLTTTEGRRRGTRVVLGGGLLLTCSSLLAGALTMNYTNAAISHFHQGLAITGEFLVREDKDEERELLSKFAQIDSREDYVAVIKRLKTIAEDNRLNYPEFSIW